MYTFLNNKIQSISLYQKLAITLTAFVFCIIFVMIQFSQKILIDSQLKAEQILNADLAQNLVNDRPELRSKDFNYNQLKEVFHNQMLLGPSFEFYLLDNMGVIKAHASQPQEILTKRIDLKPVKDFLRGRHHFPIYSQDPKSTHATKIFSASPIYYSDNQHLNQAPDLKGYLYIIIGGEKHDIENKSIKQDISTNYDLIFLVGTMIMLMAFLLILFAYITKPLRELTIQANQVWLNDQEFENIELVKWSNHGNNEIHNLGNSVNEMIGRLQSQFKQLKAVDNTRKELLADLSHDLRTPLASLMGYLEILQLKQNLSDEKKEEFLKVIVRNTKLLKGLIDQIFELAYLENKEVTINEEAFSLTELMGDIVAKNQLCLKQKNISISLVPHNHEFMVFTDIEKLERIISNLFDNAIRHTPVDGKIEFIIKQNKTDLTLCICDNGIGIHPSDVKKIFNPRFKAKNSIGDKKSNMGLGLSISKKLAELLNGNIEVDSQLGNGATFRIVLHNINYK